ncbi:hypothetical protein TorRG33x02_220530, partial [Trema orientale]
MTYMRRLGRLPDQLPEVFSIALPSGEILYSDQWLKRVPLQIDDRELFVDHVLLEMQEYE